MVNMGFVSAVVYQSMRTRLKPPIAVSVIVATLFSVIPPAQALTETSVARLTGEEGEILKSTGTIGWLADPTHRKIVRDRIFIPKGKLVRAQSWSVKNDRDGNKEIRLMLNQDGIWFYGYTEAFELLPISKDERVVKTERFVGIPRTRLAVHLRPGDSWLVSQQSGRRLSLKVRGSELSDDHEFEIRAKSLVLEVPDGYFHNPKKIDWSGGLTRAFVEQRWGFNHLCTWEKGDAQALPNDHFGIKMVREHLEELPQVGGPLLEAVKSRTDDVNYGFRVRYYRSERASMEYAWINSYTCNRPRKRKDFIIVAGTSAGDDEGAVAIDVTEHRNTEDLARVYDPRSSSFTGQLGISCVKHFKEARDYLEQVFEVNGLDDTSIGYAGFFISAMAKHYDGPGGWPAHCLGETAMRP